MLYSQNVSDLTAQLVMSHAIYRYNWTMPWDLCLEVTKTMPVERITEINFCNGDGRPIFRLCKWLTILTINS